MWGWYIGYASIPERVHIYELYTRIPRATARSRTQSPYYATTITLTSYCGTPTAYCSTASWFLF